MKYASRTSARSVGRAAAVPEAYWDEHLVEEMSEEQRAVMWGPYSNHGGELPLLNVTEQGEVRIERKNSRQKPQGQVAAPSKQGSDLPKETTRWIKQNVTSGT